MVNKLNKLFKLKDEKSKTVFKNVFFSFFIKAINISVSFLTIPLVLSFLNTTQYGIWLTLTAILGWFSIFDLGFGNGLRNHLTIAIANKNHDDGRIYVSTTYAALSLVFGAILIIFLMINPLINWRAVFNAPVEMSLDIQIAVTYSMCLLFVQFVLRLINNVLLAFQRSAMADFINALVQVFILIGLYAVKLTPYHSLTAVALVYSIMPVLVFLLLSVILYNKTYSYLTPKFTFVKFRHAKGLLNVGLNFFVIQIAALVLYASDNFIIAQYFSPADVAVYNIAFKYFSVSNIIFSIVLAPFWSMTTKAYAESDWKWIRATMKKLFMFWGLLILLIIFQLIFSAPFYKIWTHNTVSVPLNLSIVMSLYYIIFTLGGIFSNFLNGVSKIRLQLYFATSSMFLNILLAILFIKVFHMGVSGIPLATTIVTALVSIISYIQYRKITNLSATGIWNK